MYSSSWREHLEHLSELFTRLRAANLKVKLSKCHFGMFECYLGHVVGNGTVRLERSKTEAVRSIPIQKTKKEIIGSSSVQRGILSPIGGLFATPLTEMTRMSAPLEVRWSPQTQKAFDLLKEKSTSSPILMCPHVPHVCSEDGCIGQWRGCHAQSAG